jgi:hypothetical protein
VDCDGSQALVISEKQCYINISTLLEDPFNFNGGESIYAKVTAVNLYGESN